MSEFVQIAGASFRKALWFSKKLEVRNISAVSAPSRLIYERTT